MTRLFHPLALLLALLLTTPLHAQTPDLLKRQGVWAQTYTGREADPSVRFGQLPNGMRYALRQNATPPGQASLRLWIGSGSLSEDDSQQGLAHFLEHMAFRGSTNVPSGDLVRILQRLGLAFGADTNAYTSLDETVYKFDLPASTRESLDTGLMLLREIAGELTLLQSEMDPERGVVLSEERVRDTPAARQGRAEMEFQLAGQRAPTRLPIGLPEILRTAPVERIRTFYEAEYRPDNAALIAVGDFDVAEMEAAIIARFSNWTPKTPAKATPDLGTPRPRGPETRLSTIPGAPEYLSFAWTSPYDATADTAARARRDVASILARSIFNKRLERLVLGADAPFLSAAAWRANAYRSARITELDIQPRPGQWATALAAAIAAQRQFAAFGPLPDEIARAAAEFRNALRIAVEGAATRPSSRIADSIVRNLGSDEIHTSPAQDLAEVESILATLPDSEIAAAAVEMFAGNGPLLFLGGPTPVEGGEPAVTAALAAALARPPEPPALNAAKPWPYAAAATPGTIASRTRIEDLDTTAVTFTNGVRLLVKQTDFAQGEIQVQVRAGQGRLGIGHNAAPTTWLVAGIAPIFRLGGTEALTFEEIQRLTAEQRLGVNLSLDDDAFLLSGTTRPADLDRQLQLLQAYTTTPGLRPAAFQRMQATIRARLPQIEATASGVFSRLAGPLLRGGDLRFQRIPDEATLDAATNDDLTRLLADDLKTGPLEVTIVGDIDADTAIAAVARSFAALPPRPARAPTGQAATLPRPTPGAQRATHNGRADQAFAMVAWTTDDFFADMPAQRRLIATAAILRARLTDQFRSVDGLTYSPSVSTDTSTVFRGSGYLLASVETPADKTDIFFAELAAIITALQTTPATPDELDRALRPLIDQRLKRLKDNDFWLAGLSAAHGDPRQLDAIRTLVSDIRTVTATDIQATAQRYLTPDSALRLTIHPSAVR